MSLERYLELLDWTVRRLRDGSTGVIPRSLKSILIRLQVSAQSWLETVARFGRRFHRAVGLADHLKAEAKRSRSRFDNGVWAAPLPGTPEQSPGATRPGTPCHSLGAALLRRLTTRYVPDIVIIHSDEAVLDPSGRVDPRKLRTIARLGNYYCRSTDLFEMERP